MCQVLGFAQDQGGTFSSPDSKTPQTSSGVPTCPKCPEVSDVSEFRYHDLIRCWGINDPSPQCSTVILLGVTFFLSLASVDPGGSDP